MTTDTTITIEKQGLEAEDQNSQDVKDIGKT